MLLTNANIQTILNNSNCVIFVYIVCALHLVMEYNLMNSHRIHFLWSYYAIGDKKKNIICITYGIIKNIIKDFSTLKYLGKNPS